MNHRALFLPGLHGTAALWSRFRPAWVSPFQHVVYRSDPDASLDDYAIQVEEAVLAETQSSAPVDLVAESFSGPVALRVVQRNRVQVRRLVLVASFAARVHPWLLAAVQKLPLGVVGEARTSQLGIVSILLNGVSDASLISDVAAVLRTISPQVLASRLGVLARLPSQGLPCACPVLALQARHDRLVPASAQAGIRETCMDCTELIIDGPHLLLLAAPEPCATAIAAFLAG